MVAARVFIFSSAIYDTCSCEKLTENLKDLPFPEANFKSFSFEKAFLTDTELFKTSVRRQDRLDNFHKQNTRPVSPLIRDIKKTDFDFKPSFSIPPLGMVNFGKYIDFDASDHMRVKLETSFGVITSSACEISKRDNLFTTSDVGKSCISSLIYENKVYYPKGSTDFILLTFESKISTGCTF